MPNDTIPSGKGTPNFISPAGPRREFSFLEFPESIRGSLQFPSANLPPCKPRVNRVMKECLKQRKDKQRFKREIGKLKLKLKKSKEETEALKSVLSKANKCKESLQALCRNSMEKLNDCNARLAKLSVEFDNQKNQCTYLYQTLKSKLDDLSNIKNLIVERDDSSRIVNKLLKLFTIDKKEDLLEGLGKVQKVMLTLPKLKNFVNEIYKMLNLNSGSSKPERILQELREVIIEAKEYKYIQNELSRILNTKITNSDILIREIKRKLLELPQYQHVCNEYMRLHNIKNIGDAIDHIKQQYILHNGLKKLCPVGLTKGTEYNS